MIIKKNFGEPFLSDKFTAQTKISLVEKGKLLSNETKVAETFCNIFENAVNKLGINKNDAKFNDEPAVSANPVDIAIQKFDNHPSAKLIRDNITLSDMSHFESFSLDEILKKVANLNGAENGTFKNIPTCCVKEVAGICSPALIKIWSNEIITRKYFPTNLKLADVTFGFKKIDSNLILLQWNLSILNL